MKTNTNLIDVINYRRSVRVYDETKEIDAELPILYNLFGSIADENSLITTYDAFFNFFISVIGEEHKLPLELQNRLTEANFFVFIGFDLTKWYIPLLMHKPLNLFIHWNLCFSQDVRIITLLHKYINIWKAGFKVAIL